MTDSVYTHAHPPHPQGSCTTVPNTWHRNPTVFQQDRTCAKRDLFYQHISLKQSILQAIARTRYWQPARMHRQWSRADIHQTKAWEPRVVSYDYRIAVYMTSIHSYGNEVSETMCIALLQKYQVTSVVRDKSVKWTRSSLRRRVVAGISANCI